MAFQARLLDALLDPNLSLRGVAQVLDLPIDQLSLVLSRPDLANEIAALDSLAATRTRLVATSLLPAAAQTARRIVDEFNEGDADCPRETALRATRILLRLSNFASGPIAPRSSIPRGTRSHEPPSPHEATPLHADLVPPPSFDADVMSSIDSDPPPDERGGPLHNPADDPTATPFDVAPDDLGADDAVARATRLIRSGAFTAIDLDDAYRLAAAESAKCDQMEADLQAELDASATPATKHLPPSQPHSATACPSAQGNPPTRSPPTHSPARPLNQVRAEAIQSTAN
ncbi:MAG: hypothetical protein ACREJD_16965 [Phycisphaerales bacterium]